MRRPGLAGARGRRRPRGPPALHSKKNSCFDLHELTITGSPTFPPSWRPLASRRLLLPNPCHSDAGGALSARGKVVVLFEDSGTLALFSERGTGFKPKRCQASHAFRLSRPVPGFLSRTLMALGLAQCSGSCISGHRSMIRLIEVVEICV